MAKKRTNKIKKRTLKKSPILNFANKKWRLIFVVSIVALIGIVVLFVSNASAPPRSVTEFGAVGDGVHDDTAAIQAGIDAVSASGTLANQAQELRLPAGTYKVTRPIFMKSNVQFRGVQGQTKLMSRSSVPGSSFIMYIGDVHPQAFDSRQQPNQQFTNYPVRGQYTKDSSSITLANIANVSQFKKDELVCIRSTKEFNNGVGTEGWSQPDIVQFNKITNINGDTLEFAQKSLNTISDPQVCKITGIDGYQTAVLGTQVNWYGIQNVEINGITFQDANFGLAGGLCYACFVKNVNFENITKPMNLNAIVNSIFSNITGTYNQNALEIKMASSRSSFKNINMTYVAPNNNQAQVHAVDVGERSVDITLNQLKLNVGPEWVVDQRLIGIGDAQDVDIINSQINLSGGGKAAVFEIRGNYDSQLGGSAFPTDKYNIANNTINLGIQKEQLAIMAGYNNSLLSDIKFSGNRWLGTETKDGTAYFALDYIVNWSVKNDYIPVATQMVVVNNSQQPTLENVRYKGSEERSGPKRKNPR
jgi:hypothetical protein